MTLSRRQFFSLAGAGTAGALLLSPLQAFYAKRTLAAGPYGALVSDPLGVLDLPAGFSYVRLSETGQMMNDGYTVPGGHDGMGAFAGANGNTILIRNHELSPTSSNGVGAPNSKKYDTKGRGGTTTLVVSSNGALVSHYGTLAGTYRNCAGGPTPWGSWLSCEESFEVGNKKHGYIFEVPSSATGFVTPVPLVAMGRFNHEAAAVDPDTGYVYLTEDRSDGLLYRFVPNTANNLSAGTLYALKITAIPQANTTTGFTVGQSHAVSWVQIANPDPASDTVRVAGFNLGAAKFARGEGIFYGNGDIYFCCTSGGSAGLGQVWRYTPATETLRLYIQPNNSGTLDFPDNIVVAPNNDIFLCEDGGGTDFIVGVTPTGSLYKFARNALNTNEFAGACFSPNGQIMFVNMQTPGITFAITGPW
ncbi:putative phosphatase [Cylindrospermum stagnale PCC 7417]|uniref:Putative phosphatase n=1 Tax=Cylindrospermum stagnale PCC 7417 TaxID=56107 RepID=K9WRE3_9NOST|nr:alkaline phosphatase PhoX [Cylindrospermum stagnale]AFZ22960.1 putative phosphatase [Cylindrospermum stagnale PCC 7417]